MKKLILLIALVLLVSVLAQSPGSVVSDTSTSLADSNISDNQMTTSQPQASNSSTSGAITITMTGVLDE